MQPGALHQLDELIRHNLDDLFPDMRSLRTSCRFRVTRNADIEARRGGGRRPAGADRGGAAPAEVRRRRAAGGARPGAERWMPRVPRPRAADRGADDVYEVPPELDFERPQRRRRLNVPRPAFGAAGRRSSAAHALADEDRRHFRGHPRGRRAGAPSLRELRRQRRAVHASRRRRSRRCWRSR